MLVVKTKLAKNIWFLELIFSRVKLKRVKQQNKSYLLIFIEAISLFSKYNAGKLTASEAV